MKKLHLLLVLCWLPLIALAQDDSSLSVERLWQLERIGQPVGPVGQFLVGAPASVADQRRVVAEALLDFFGEVDGTANKER